MKIGAMLGDITRSLFKRPVTERYPFERKAAPERLRGKVVWDPTKCTGCQLCVKDCPSEALELLVVDKATKRFVMRYHSDRCTFCAQCVETCRQECLHMESDAWELAALNREPFTVNYGRDEDIATVISREAGNTPANVPQAE